MKHRVTILFWFILWALSLHAQTPTLNQFMGKNGIDRNSSSAASANNNIFTLDPPSYPRGVSAGSLIIMSGRWPDSLSSPPTTCASHCLPTFTDNNSNVLTAVFSTTAPCMDANGIDHGIYYENATAGAYYVKETHPVRITNSYWNISNWYNVAASSPLDGSSCKPGVTPINNTAPNIQGTAFSTTAGDLVYVEVNDNSTEVSWNSITVPSNCTVLGENNYEGHAQLYCIAQGSTFTPQFTVAQSSHSTFTIMAAAFKPGAGGSAPNPGAAILLSVQNYTGGAETRSFNVGCPTSTTAIAFTDDASYLTAVSDNLGGGYTKVTPGGGPATIWYKLGVTISNPNAFAMTMTTAGGGNDLLTTYCLNVKGIDTNVTAGGSSSVVAPGTVYHGITESGGGGVSTYTDLPTMTPSLPGDLFIITGSSGVGPILTCAQPANCIYDFPSPTALADVTSGDANTYTNGDIGGHFWQSGTGQIDFGWSMKNNSAGTSTVVTAFSAPASGGTPAPPTGLTVTVQ